MGPHPCTAIPCPPLPPRAPRNLLKLAAGEEGLPVLPQVVDQGANALARQGRRGLHPCGPGSANRAVEVQRAAEGGGRPPRRQLRGAVRLVDHHQVGELGDATLDHLGVLGRDGEHGVEYECAWRRPLPLL